MAKLPSDAVLAKLYHLGLSDAEIAQQYGARPGSVNSRLVLLNLRRRPVHARVNALLATIWDVKVDRDGGETHHNAYPIRYLKVYLRLRLGDETISATERMKAGRLIRRLVRENKVIHYNTEKEGGWEYVPRLPSDGRRVLRWPENQALPDQVDLQRAMELPEETQGGPAA
ncbi:hypothetical protein [Streptomyces sp. UNOB3_S3]|uniref:hypothetical protein n=1 Tax=Streptomyces sp. UNOB3_S3 TaxID=2871682 RepID=UPI001E3745A7|nr:hypothetical protein [Streptomyces sp. UNOB3_S3]MCC3775182.1 hypothetical protein [Streptomyces sp. UNOB3_S3]